MLGSQSTTLLNAGLWVGVSAGGCCLMVNEYQLLGLINSNGCGLLAAYIHVSGPMAEAGWLGPNVGGRLALYCIHHANRVNSHNGTALVTAL